MDNPTKVDRLIAKVKAGTGHKIHLSSKSFWDQLDIKRRTPQAITFVSEQFIHSGIQLLLEGEFGREPDDQRIDLKYWEIPVPDDLWFEQMDKKVFDNEQEVDVFFLSPLFSKLGYMEIDFAFEYPVNLSHKITKRKKGDQKEKVDLVLFNGTDRSHSNILVVCEAKKPDIEKASRNLSNMELAEQESKNYCIELELAKRRVATNGDVIRVYRLRPNIPEPLIETHRSELKDRWHQLYLCLAKPILLGEK